MLKYKSNNMILSSLLCCLSLFATACDDNDNNNDQQTTEEQPIWVSGDVRVLTTTSNRSKDLTPSAITFSTKDNMSPRSIYLKGDQQYQEIDGFGAAITGATAVNLLKMEQSARTKFLKETFSTTDGYGMSYVRVCIGCSDFSLSEYTCCDTEGIENFALTNEETNYVIPVLKEILAINPDVKILASPWTAPRWMKVNNLNDLQPYNSWTGGRLNPAYYQDYAEYFVKWIQAFKQEGINIYAVTLQNEPLNTGNSASMYMSWQEQRDFIKQAVGPKFAAAGITAKIYTFDHNYDYDGVEDQKSYPTNIYADAEASKYVAGAAYHNYGGNRSELNTVHSANPDKELIFTESTAGDWNDGSNLTTHLNSDMEEIFIGTVNNWTRGAIVWNLMLDANRGPNRSGGCTTGFGAVDIDANYKTITRNSFYYDACHCSAVVKPGAHRIATSGYTVSGLSYAAFRNTDGTYAFVCSNSSSDALSITLDDGTHHFSTSIPSKSIMSFIW
jgi:glucosylceramidase